MDIVLEYDIGINLNLKDVRVVKGITTNTMSLLQLVGEGWTMSVAIINKKKVIQMKFVGERLVIYEKDKKSLCCKNAKIINFKTRYVTLGFMIIPGVDST